MITEDYCSFKVAKLLKEKGFPQKYDVFHSMVYNEEDYEDEYEVQRMVLQTKLVKAGTLSSYPVGVPEPKCYCPTHQMAMKWLREKHKVFIYIEPFITTSGLHGYKPYCTKIGGEFMWINPLREYSNTSSDIYEEAVEAALKYCLENLIQL